MKIESITRLNNKPDKFLAIFEDGTEVNVGTSQIADFNLYTGRILTRDEYSMLRGELELSASKARALRILGNRNYSANEMVRRLTAKGETQTTAEETARWLEDIGAINDEQYAEGIVAHYSAKGYGLSKIKDELYRRGIPRGMWEHALAALSDEDGAAYDFLSNKLRGSRDETDVRRAMDALYRRGFSYEQARTAANRYIDNIDENEK